MNAFIFCLVCVTSGVLGVEQATDQIAAETQYQQQQYVQQQRPIQQQRPVQQPQRNNRFTTTTNNNNNNVGVPYRPQNAEVSYTSPPQQQIGQRPQVVLRGRQDDNRLTTTVQVDSRCGGQARGQTAHPDNCALYYNCWDEIVLLSACPNGLLFDSINMYCDYPENVDCQGRTATEPPISTENCPTLWGLFRGPQCSSFYNCVDGVAFEVNCPAGLAFNEPTKSCEYPEKVPGCENILPFQCPDQYGNHPADDPDCRQFWLCVDGKARLLACDKNRKFDRISRKCLDEFQATC